MVIEKQVSLKQLNTFGIDVKAAHFTSIEQPAQLEELIQDTRLHQQRHLILGGGSNLLFLGDFDGLIIHSRIKGIVVMEETEDWVVVKAGSGESWHGLVLHCLQQQWGGLENLSLIPGTAGAAPLQNIGAYGVEVKDVIEYVDTVDLVTGKARRFSNKECQFQYRESVFKRPDHKNIFISSITLRLTKKNHALNTQYSALQEVLQQHKILSPTIHDISRVVIGVRQSKLPDPNEVGNAGSFFKNPTISLTLYNSIQEKYPKIPSYPIDNQYVKIPAGWLIEQCGWKGFTRDGIGVHPRQALVLVNYGNGNGQKIYQLAMDIQSSVNEKFNVQLTPEVNIIS
ncbi:MAG TPA: UDP-N-acetylmuramate dehydrogenase [Cyclobacteriaceae bacterium]|nr:UDP-N-acetylmuramate dehydrogenase [Cyclobacteriaceae bacterium]